MRRAVLMYHDATCCGAFPHAPEHRSEHDTREAAVAAVPLGRIGYITPAGGPPGCWFLWVVSRNGELSKYGARA